ncbi:hypothetical protein HYW20_04295 [Candidatus Woesearchaeota archaeon]|nr:hypothetical protein [Candidatus Woesearchaeota archaeon]
MRKKDLFVYCVILVLVILFLWQWLSKGALISQKSQLQRYTSQMQVLSGIGALGSIHIHADVKAYIDGKSMDFSQKKYQLASSFIHFEDGIGDVVHVHATGMTLGHLFRSLGMDFNNNCIAAEGQSYCNDADKTLKFYVNGQPDKEFDNKAIRDLDKYLVSYGSDNEAQIQKQLDSVTSLAPKYSADKAEMD